jgi:hypothetical protein
MKTDKFNGNSIKAGTWIEIQDYLPYIYSDHNDEMPCINGWLELIREAYATCGIRLDSPRLYQHLLRNSGFVNIRKTVMKIPMNGWSENPLENEIGNLQRNIMMGGFDAISLRPLLTVKRLERTVYQSKLAGVLSELRNERLRGYFKL